ncbi:hypothetical protein DXT89_18370 [Agrobacterium vitis]|uniref:Uncharacterized protein n=1 Tax=Agrobacterium vitis TaxID=373 RepID=A0A368NJ55_AGRVI|nr:hypothetical protein DXM22_16580 [Agrobacterium vitis]KAA3525297.1 hypothetical protein DXT89_18370 [Agrobacterium vitis]RCU50186.1 hypothetical protein ASB66_022615 [Agrobacterium vitis]
MYEMTKTKGSFTKMRTLRWRLAITFLKIVFRKEERLIYSLKALGMSDLFCVRALEFAYHLDNHSASMLIGKFIANPFTEPKI